MAAKKFSSTWVVVKKGETPSPPNLRNETPNRYATKFEMGEVIGDASVLVSPRYNIGFADDVSEYFRFGSNLSNRVPFTHATGYFQGYYSVQPNNSLFFGKLPVRYVVPQHIGAHQRYDPVEDPWVAEARDAKLTFAMQHPLKSDYTSEGKLSSATEALFMFPISSETGYPYNVGSVISSGLSSEDWLVNPLGYQQTQYRLEDFARTPGQLSVTYYTDESGTHYPPSPIFMDGYICKATDKSVYLVLDKRNKSDWEKRASWTNGRNPNDHTTVIPGAELEGTSQISKLRFCILKLNSSATVWTTHVDENGVIIQDWAYPSQAAQYQKTVYLSDIIEGIEKELPDWTDYPYDPTPPHGGGGAQDFSSDAIPSPSNPNWSAVACGLCKAYSPTLAEVQAMAGELWSSDFVDSMKKLYNDPMEAVISFGVLPVQPITGSATTPLVVGNYTFTSASARPVTSNFVTVDCGEVTLPKQYDGFQDYEPYTKIQIYLPFIGNQTVTPSDVVGKPAHLYYRIDVLTGACLAWLSVENRVLYQWTGNCFTEIPLSKNSKSQIYSQIIHGIVNTITSTAKGGVAGGAAGAAIGGASGIISTITDVATSKHSDVMRTGALNPASSTLGVRTPYFIISYPTMVTPEGYAAAMGIPVNAGGTIGDFSGYTVVDSVHLENIAATENELREIESLLTGGVIL